MIQRIYQRSKLKRNLRSATHSQQIEFAPISQLDVKVHTEPGRAYMRVIEYGADFIQLVQFRLRELCLRRVDCIYMDLPLSHPATAQFCAALEMMGFFFAGVIPELFNGDMLRLQYLNNVDIDPKDIITASDFGRELLEYVLKLKEVHVLSLP